MNKHIKKDVRFVYKTFFAVLSTIALVLFSPCMVSLTMAESTVLEWDANNETNLAGYKVYYDTSSSDGPYNGTGLKQGNSPIRISLAQLKNPAKPSFALSGLNSGKHYFFGVTAYTQEGKESKFSNIVGHEVPLPSIYTLQASASGQGSILPEGVLLALEKSSQTFSITPAKNHYIADVLVDGASMGPIKTYTFSDISRPHTIEAVFESNTYTIHASATGNGTITPSGAIQISHGLNHTYKISAETGYQLTNVKVDGISIGPTFSYSFVEVSDNHTIEAIFNKRNTSVYALIPRNQISIFSVSSEELVGNERPAEYAIDGRTDTHWHTKWFNGADEYPHEIILDTGKLRHISGLQYLPRQVGNENGTIIDYSIYVSRDAADWGDPVAEGSFGKNIDLKEVNFPDTVGRYVRFVALSEINGQPFASAAEIGILSKDLADTDADGLFDIDEINLYDTRPDMADTDQDGISDGDEKNYWQDQWNLDHDADGIINLLDWDSDGDGFSDGQEIENGTDPTGGNADYVIIPRDQISIFHVDSEELVGNHRPATYAIDGHSDTHWHTKWFNGADAGPHEIILEIDKDYNVGGIQYLPRQDGNENGTIVDYAVYVSTNPDDWEEPVAKGAFNKNMNLKEIHFSDTPGRYIRLVALSEINGQSFACAAEIRILAKEVVDTDKDGLSDSDEINLFGTHPNIADTDQDGISDGDEKNFWHDQWDMDHDADGTINLLDWDSDGDGFSDGQEIENGTDPSGENTGYVIIPHNQINIFHVDSEELIGNHRPAEYAIDGRPDTHWHTKWYNGADAGPHEIIIEIDRDYNVGGIQYLPRQDGNENGTIVDYAIYLSRDGIDWEEPVAQGSFGKDTNLKEIYFPASTARYVRFVALSEINGKPFACAAEIGILGR